LAHDYGPARRDGANTLGYNLGAALGAIHLKQHLLKNAVEDITKGSK
jgi:hypothetical protein